MKNARFKIGEKVRVRKDLVSGKIYGGLTFYSGSMANTKGYEGVITQIGSKSDTYCIKGSVFWYSEEMLESVESNTIVIYRKDNEVIAVNKSTGKSAKAKCSKEDTFDFEIGAKLAFERLVNPKKRVPIFKIGDKVRLKDGLVVGQQYGGLTLFAHMREQFPSIAIIRSVDSGDCTYHIEGLTWWFSEEMLELAPKTKFKVGDRVIGNAKANKYGITCKDWRGKIIDISKDNRIYVKNNFNGPFWVDSECFDLDTTPKYYTGKVIALADMRTDFTKGKIYNCEDGKLIDNHKCKRPCTPLRYSSFEDLNKDFRYRFIEVVE